jgi:IS5 family transposase
VRRYVVSDASVHDSQKFEDVLDASNTASDVWADSAYRSAEIEEKLAECGLKSRIHRRACRNRKLSEAQKAPTRPARRCAPVSSMYLVIKRTAWEPSSCAPSASSARDAKSE